MKRLFTNSKGSFTVEASIIFSITFLLICSMVYIFIIMYQYIVIQSTADQAANIGAQYYVNISSNTNLYWRIFDQQAESKKGYLRNSINKDLNQLILHSGRNVDIQTTNRLFLKQLDVSLIESFPIPLGSLFRIFGLNPAMSIKAEAITPLDDKPEFIRNLDTVIDIKNCILNSDNKWIGKDSKVSDVISKLVKKN